MDRVPPLKTFSRAGSPLWESSGSCGRALGKCGRSGSGIRRSGRGLGACWRFVAPSEVWGLWELYLSRDLHCGRALGGVRESSGRGVGVGELWNGSGRAAGWEWNARLTRSTSDGSADSNSNSNSNSSSNSSSNSNHENSRNDNTSNTIASRIPAARPEGSPFAAQGILIF